MLFSYDGQVAWCWASATDNCRLSYPHFGGGSELIFCQMGAHAVWLSRSVLPWRGGHRVGHDKSETDKFPAECYIPEQVGIDLGRKRCYSQRAEGTGFLNVL